MHTEAQRAKEEGADFIANDTMPAAEPSASERRAQELAKKFAIETMDEYRAQVENDPEVPAKLAESFDTAINSIMIDEGLSANDGGEGEKFYKAAQAEKVDYIKFLMNEMVNKHIDAEEAITASGKDFISRLKPQSN